MRVPGRSDNYLLHRGTQSEDYGEGFGEDIAFLHDGDMVLSAGMDGVRGFWMY